MEKTVIDSHFQQLINFVFETNQNIFLTGKAGTGKTTALKYIRDNCKKQLVVAAPTGVAAINAGGTTIHSLFQFPFYAFMPNNPKKLLESLKYNSKRLQILRELELLIIDEVSMVRADMLDAIDVTLRSVRKRREVPFGGVQVLLIGDMYQLPPVVRNDEWVFLKQFYNSPYFFDSQVFKENKPTYLELTKVYRQTDQSFIDLLNKVRNNAIDAQTIEALNARFEANITQSDLEKIITLTTHNHKADAINKNALQRLTTKSFAYKASVKGNFPEKIFPVSETLELKEGARVMFVKNDQNKRYFNGLIGEILKINKDSIAVTCKGVYGEIEVGKEIWENVNYTHNKKTNQIQEEKLGEFEQYPLRLAWAITIHKSQGLTFDEVVIDAQEAFSSGQVYVALSRCRSLEGLRLKTKIANNSLLNDDKIVGFAQTKPKEEEIKDLYQISKKKYSQDLIKGIFGFSIALEDAKQIEVFSVKNEKNLNPEAIPFFKNLVNNLEAIRATAEKFDAQLTRLFGEVEAIEKYPELQNRIAKGANYFLLEIHKIAEEIENHKVSTESKVTSDEISPLLHELWVQLLVKKNFLDACLSGFNLNVYTNKKLALQLPSKKISIYATKTTVSKELNIDHPVLLEQLFEVRKEIIEETMLPIFMVSSKETLMGMALYLPQTKEDLIKIKGFGKAKVEAYGSRFLDVINTYCSEYNLDTRIFEVQALEEKKTKKEPKINTKELSFELYNSLKDIDLVAKERNLTRGTIESHLGHYVLLGELPLDELIPIEKHLILKKILMEKTAEQSYSETLALLPEGYAYSEIRLMEQFLALEVKS